jgi:hypothetical protein
MYYNMEPKLIHSHMDNIGRIPKKSFGLNIIVHC